LCEDPSLTKFTPAKYNDALSLGEKQFALDSKCLYKTQAYVMAVNDATYDLPADFVQDKIVTLNGIELEPISKDSLCRLYKSQRWDTLTGTPTNYVVDAIEANKALRIFPIPSSIADGTALELTYYAYPVAMSGDSSTPFNSSALLTPYHIAVAHYGAWLLLGYLQPTDPIISKRRDLLAQYTSKVTEALQTFGDTKSEPMQLRPNDVRAR
jgi:hypothetical protein